LSGDPNVGIHESKALLCAVLPGPPPRGTELVRWLEAYGGGDDEALEQDKQDSGPGQSDGGVAELGNLQE